MTTKIIKLANEAWDSAETLVGGSSLKAAAGILESGMVPKSAFLWVEQARQAEPDNEKIQTLINALLSETLKDSPIQRQIAAEWRRIQRAKNPENIGGRFSEDN